MIVDIYDRQSSSTLHITAVFVDFLQRMMYRKPNRQAVSLLSMGKKKEKTFLWDETINLAFICI
jgi:hypothetical protein